MVVWAILELLIGHVVGKPRKHQNASCHMVLVTTRLSAKSHCNNLLLNVDKYTKKIINLKQSCLSLFDRTKIEIVFYLKPGTIRRCNITILKIYVFLVSYIGTYIAKFIDYS